MEKNPSVNRLKEVLAQLDVADDEHASVALTHESEWSLGAYPSGLLVWENLEHNQPRHLNRVSRDRVLELWVTLSVGNLSAIEGEPWLPGYEDPV
jgi:hypothetical protein